MVIPFCRNAFRMSGILFWSYWNRSTSVIGGISTGGNNSAWSSNSDLFSISFNVRFNAANFLIYVKIVFRDTPVIELVLLLPIPWQWQRMICLILLIMIGLFDIICGFLNRKLFKPIINFEPSFSGGQFALNEGGQFARNLGGQFTLKTGGQFDGILQVMYQS